MTRSYKGAISAANWRTMSDNFVDVDDPDFVVHPHGQRLGFCRIRYVGPCNAVGNHRFKTMKIDQANRHMAAMRSAMRTLNDAWAISDPKPHPTATAPR